MEDLAFLEMLQCFDQAWQAFTLKTERERNLLPSKEATFMNAVEVQSLFSLMKNVDATVGDVEPQRLQLNPKRYNESLQIIHSLHRENGAGELRNCFVNLFWGCLGHWSRPARMNPDR